MSLSFTLSLKARLVALTVLSVLAVGALGALFISSNRANDTALDALYLQSVESLVRLQRIDRNLVEVRFRAAGVLIDQMPITGSLNHLRETRRAIDAEWTEVDATLRQSLAGEALDTLGALETDWPRVAETLSKLERAYVVAPEKSITY